MELSESEKIMKQKEEDRAKRLQTVVNGTNIQLDHVLDYLDSDGGLIKNATEIHSNVSWSITVGESSVRNLDLLLEKLCDDGYVKPFEVRNGRADYGITFRGRSFLADTWFPYRRQPYRQKRAKEIIRFYWNIIKAVAVTLNAVAILSIAIFGGWLAWKTYSLQDPILKINPDDWSISSKRPGSFEFTLCNTGISDVSDIQIFGNYFIPAQDTPLTLYSLPARYNMLADTTISSLEKGEKTLFQINFKQLPSDMTKLYENKKGMLYTIVRLKIKFNRAEDKKEFETSKYYQVGGNGEILFSEDNRGTNSSIEVPIREIKRMLGD